jgi:hypothetical protein
MRKIELKEELKNYPLINQYQVELPTNEVPEGYFEDMEDRFFENLRSTEISIEPTKPKASFWSRFSINQSIAAVVSLAIVGFMVFNIINPQNAGFQLSDNDIETYLEEQEVTIIGNPLANFEIKEDAKQKISDSLDKISETDIIQYIKEIEEVELNNL